MKAINKSDFLSKRHVMSMVYRMVYQHPRGQHQNASSDTGIHLQYAIQSCRYPGWFNHINLGG